MFIDSVLCLDEAGRPYPLRDPFLNFIGKVGGDDRHVVILSRCKSEAVGSTQVEYLETGKDVRFVPLPFYEDSEEFLLNRRRIIQETIPIADEAIRTSDVVVIRVHHSLAGRLSASAKRHNKPIVLFWSGPMILESAKRNYPGLRPRAIVARLIARWRMRVFKTLARRAAANLFLDRNEWAVMGRPPRSTWVLESRVRAEAIVQGPRPRTEEALQITFAGRVFRHKGIFDLLDALVLLKREGVNFRVTVAGHGPDQVEFDERVQTSGLSSEVKCVGNLNFDQVQQLLRRSDVFVLPSYAEGMPKAILESWAAGAAVVATDVGTVGHYLHDSVNGRLLKPGDVAALASALKELATDDAKRRRLISAGIETVKEHTFDHEIAIVRNTLTEVIAQRRALER